MLSDEKIQKLTSAAATDTNDGSKDDPMGRQRDARKSRPSLTLNVPASRRAVRTGHIPCAKQSLGKGDEM